MSIIDSRGSNFTQVIADYLTYSDEEKDLIISEFYSVRSFLSSRDVMVVQRTPVSTNAFLVDIINKNFYLEKFLTSTVFLTIVARSSIPLEYFKKVLESLISHTIFEYFETVFYKNNSLVYLERLNLMLKYDEVYNKSAVASAFLNESYETIKNTALDADVKIKLARYISTLFEKYRNSSQNFRFSATVTMEAAELIQGSDTATETILKFLRSTYSSEYSVIYPLIAEKIITIKDITETLKKTEFDNLNKVTAAKKLLTNDGIYNFLNPQEIKDLLSYFSSDIGYLFNTNTLRLNTTAKFKDPVLAFDNISSNITVMYIQTLKDLYFETQDDFVDLAVYASKTTPGLLNNICSTVVLIDEDFKKYPELLTHALVSAKGRITFYITEATFKECAKKIGKRPKYLNDFSRSDVIFKNALMTRCALTRKSLEFLLKNGLSSEFIFNTIENTMSETLTVQPEELQLIKKLQ